MQNGAEVLKYFDHRNLEWCKGKKMLISSRAFKVNLNEYSVFTCKNWLRYSRARASESVQKVYALKDPVGDTQGEDSLDEKFYIRFAQFEERQKETERARMVCKAGWAASSRAVPCRSRQLKKKRRNTYRSRSVCWKPNCSRLFTKKDPVQ